MINSLRKTLAASVLLLISSAQALGEGALVIAGGSSLPSSIRSEFIDLAGGKEAARLVLIPTASIYADDADYVSGRIKRWRDLGAASVEVIHTRDRKKAEDAEFVTPLRQATGVWISGGNQSRLTATYGGTLVEAEMRRLLKRGGVVGGTSAGAAVMSNPMITGGNPVAKTGSGFGFLPSVIVDQHFVARNRMPRLRSVLSKLEDYAGLGIDESTAAVIRDGAITVRGESTVTAVWPASSSQPRRELVLAAGEVLRLSELREPAANP
ncbi:MAG: cyanophycinase [Planctomycetota bacterium]